MITNSEFGATDPLPDGNRIIFSDYSSSGNNICFTSILPDKKALPSGKSYKAFLIDRVKPSVNVSETGLKYIIYLPGTKNGSISSGFTAGCRFMPILRK